jgi:hypothetical protein
MFDKITEFIEKNDTLLTIGMSCVLLTGVIIAVMNGKTFEF